MLRWNEKPPRNLKRQVPSPKRLVIKAAFTLAKNISEWRKVTMAEVSRALKNHVLYNYVLTKALFQSRFLRTFEISRSCLITFIFNYFVGGKQQWEFSRNLQVKTRVLLDEGINIYPKNLCCVVSVGNCENRLIVLF